MNELTEQDIEQARHLSGGDPQRLAEVACLIAENKHLRGALDASIAYNKAMWTEPAHSPIRRQLSRNLEAALADLERP
jgi:hypothetical protein